MNEAERRELQEKWMGEPWHKWKRKRKNEGLRKCICGNEGGVFTDHFNCTFDTPQDFFDLWFSERVFPVLSSEEWRFPSRSRHREFFLWYDRKRERGPFEELTPADRCELILAWLREKEG